MGSLILFGNGGFSEEASEFSFPSLELVSGDLFVAANDKLESTHNYTPIKFFCQIIPKCITQFKLVLSRFTIIGVMRFLLCCCAFKPSKWKQ